MTVSVEIINQLNDNYSYLICSNENNSGIVIDPAESDKILEVLKKKKINLDYILITHHHSDHTSGVIDLVKAYPAVKVFSPSELNSISINKISDGKTITTSLNKFEVIHAPGHTLDHIVLCDHKNNLLFVGDVIFRLGCGRVFEGTFEQMHNSLLKLLNLSDRMLVYCGHEYTFKNLEFCLKFNPNNDFLKKKKNNIELNLKNKKPTIPSTIADEIKANIFFRVNDPDVKKAINLENSPDIEIFTKLRDLKDNF